MIAVVESLVPVFLLIALGAFVTHRGLLTAETWVGVERVTYHVLIPALMISTLSRTRLDPALLASVGLLLSGGVLTLAASTMAARPWLERRYGLDGPAFTSVFQGATRWNTFAAIAIAGTLFGPPGTAVVAVAIIAMVPLLNLLCVAVLVRHASGKGTTPLAFLVTLAKNPFIWGSAVGIALNLLGDPVPRVIHTGLSLLSQATLAMGLLMVGGGLDMKTALRVDGPVIFTSVLKLLLMPAAMIGGGLWLGLTGSALGAVALCAAVPTASASYLLAKQMGGDAPLMARIITTQTLMGMATMPVWLLLAAGF